LSQTVHEWKLHLIDYLQISEINGKKLHLKDAESAAIKMISCYEGLTQLYLITEDINYLKRLETGLIDAIKE